MKQTIEEKAKYQKEYQKEWYLKNKEAKDKKNKEYYLKNKEAIDNYQKEWYLNNKEVVIKRSKEYNLVNKEAEAIRDKEYYLVNKEARCKYDKEYYLKNKEAKGIRGNEYDKKQYKINPLYRLKKNIRTLISFSFSNKTFKKKTRTHEILGCSFEEFKTYLEGKFESWMTWENKGNPKDGILELNKTWDIDHIEPISSAITEEDVIRLNHYLNLQPLCSYYNRNIKRNKK